MNTVTINKIRVSKAHIDLCYDRDGIIIDDWLEEHIGRENYTEWIGFIELPYRSWSFYHAEHETLFALRWT